MNNVDKAFENPANLSSQPAEMPTVPGLPLIGSLLDLVKNPIEFLKQQHAQYGEVFRFHAAHKKFVVLAGVEANRFIASEGRDLFSSRETWGRFLNGLNCPHLFIGVDGDVHQYQRKLFKPQLSKAAFKDKLDLLVGPIEKEILSLQTEEVSVGPFVRSIVCKQIGKALQGVEVSSQQTEEFMRTQNTLLNVYMLGKWPKLFLMSPKFLVAAWHSANFSKQIRDSNRKRSEEERLTPTYLDKLEQGQRDHPEWFTEGDMRAQTMLPFIGGVDPVGGTLSFIIYELLKQPSLLKRVQTEVDAAYEKAGGFPGLDGLEEMEDVKGLILETMRLYPIAYAMSRSATADFDFGGYRIRKGEELMIFTVANHFKSANFPEPEKFDIERYREPRNENKQGAVYAPFGRGPHTCIAAGLAELQLMVNMVVLLRYVDMSPAVDLAKVRVEFLPGPFMTSNFKIRLRKRN
jgi:cytochrome P450